MTKISGWKTIGSTYRPALAMLAIMLVIAFGSTSQRSVIFDVAVWTGLALCFVWIFKILRRGGFGRGGKKTRLLVQFSMAVILMLAYGFVVFVIGAYVIIVTGRIHY